jgi:GNAT superfamily N-acetyltransferase
VSEAVRSRGEELGLVTLVEPSTITNLYRLDLTGSRAVAGEAGPLYATVVIERTRRQVDVQIRLTGHVGLYQRGIGVRRTLQINGFGEVREGGVKIPGGFFEVHNDLKRHGLGAIMMNAMLDWAHAYHPSATILPIGVTHASFSSKSTPVPFYNRYGFTWTAASDANKLYSHPRPVATIHAIPLRYPVSVPTLPEQPDPWRN